MGLDLATEGDLVMEEFQMAQIMMQIKLKKTFIIKIYQKKMMSQYKTPKYCLFTSIIISLKEIKYLCITISFQEQ
jgi:hypothetical protein